MITKDKDCDVFDVLSFIASSTKSSSSSSEIYKKDMAAANGPAVSKPSHGFKPLEERLVASYVKSHSQLAERLGGTPGTWSIKEVGDGNMNYVFILVGTKGSFVLKQVNKDRHWMLLVFRLKITIFNFHFAMSDHCRPLILSHNKFSSE